MVFMKGNQEVSDVSNLIICCWIPRCKKISCHIFSRLLTDLYLWFILRVRTESWIHWNFPSNFPNLEKKSGKMVNSLGFFFFSKLQQVLYKWNFHFDQILFNLARTFAVRCEKSFVLLITYLITFSLEKEIIVWKKIWKKVWNFGSKNLHEPCIHVFMLMYRFSAMPGAFCQIRIQFLCLY